MFNKQKVLSRARSRGGQTPNWGSKGESSGLSFDDRAIALFHLDSLIPHQFYSTFKRTVHLAPEEMLMLAILQDAVSVFQNFAGIREKKRRELFHETEDWILDTDRSYFFSFENVCESLGLNPCCLRQGLMHWKADAIGARHARRLAS